MRSKESARDLLDTRLPLQTNTDQTPNIGREAAYPRRFHPFLLPLLVEQDPRGILQGSERGTQRCWSTLSSH